ncbi:SecY-interacting protein [Glaciecola sp. SC05]|uniref:SecY-interacting protein n=1 Tax=Glaciecola sp. SC05 TaxID=1987355 RepID=UPI00352905C0
MAQSFEHTFDRFVQQYIDLSTEENRGLVTEYDSAWPSPCLQGSLEQLTDGGDCAWRPSLNKEPASLADLASALEIHIPNEFEALFCRYYSLDLHASHPRGPVTLLQVWNSEDYDRLQKNLIAHVLMKRRLKLPDTLFFALTDQDDLVISLDIATQNVILEPVGKPATETLSENLVEFIAALRPVPQAVNW